MQISSEIINDVIVIKPQGKLMGDPQTIACHQQVKNRIGEGQKKIVIDLSKVDWINSAGIGMLIACYTSCTNAGGYFKIAGPSDKSKSMLKMTKLITVFDIFEDAEQAVKSYSK